MVRGAIAHTLVSVHVYCLGSCVGVCRSMWCEERLHTLLSRFMCIVSVHVWEYVGQCGARSDCTHSCSGTFVASNSHAQSFLHAFLFSINFLFHSFGGFFHNECCGGGSKTG